MDDPDNVKSRGGHVAVRGTGRVRVVTHKRPHLDEVVSIWLLRRYDPAFRDCTYEFIPYFGTAPTGDDVVTVGIGGGKYDEHKLESHTSAVQLVYNDLIGRKLILPGDQAVRQLVEYTDRLDRGQFMTDDHDGWPFTPPALLRSHIERTKNDDETVRFWLELVDDMVHELTAQAQFMADWAERFEFDSPWGRAVALISDYQYSDSYAYTHGFPVRIQKHRHDPVSSIKLNPMIDGDLTPVYAKAVALEPEAWYLHQAKKMVISSIDPSIGRQPSQLSLTQLVELVKT